MKTITLSRGYYARVDDEDYESLRQSKWYPQLSTNTYYAVGVYCGIATTMHRVIMNPGVGLEIDHIDGNGLNNQRSNLRVLTHKENGKNRHARESSEYEHVAKGHIKKHNVHAWKADGEDLALLDSLEKLRIEKSESARVRAGLRALAREKQVV